MNEKHFKKVIKELDNEFDSHKFIEKFMSMYEKEYVELLCFFTDIRLYSPFYIFSWFYFLKIY